ncbi:MAG: RNA polymerase sigma factor [Actinomycetota bacterium]
MAQDLATEFVADLYRRERAGITRSIARIAGESHAEDLVHDAFVAYLTKSPWATKPGAWVATVAKNRALNELRRPKLVPLEDDDSPTTIEDADVEREALRSVVASALSGLQERSLVALRMKFFEGADYPQIAKELGVRVAQAHVIVHRALRRLGRELVHRMADAHGASSCTPALLRMAGLGSGDDEHDDAPCPTCAPAWDEISSLRIGAWIPGPLIAAFLSTRHRLHKIYASIASRMSAQSTLAADALSKAAACFAVGVAATSIAPAVVSANAPVMAMQVQQQKSSFQQTLASREAGKSAIDVHQASSGSSNTGQASVGVGKQPPTTLSAGPTKTQVNPGGTSHADTPKNSSVVCTNTDLSKPCGN